MNGDLCRGGLILYRTVIKGSELQGTAVLDISEPVRDYARVSLVSLVNSYTPMVQH